MIKEKLKKENGITLVSLVIATIVIVILANVIIYNVRDNLKVGNLKEMQNDISNLRDKVSSYYSENGKIPASIEYTNIENIRNAGVINSATDTGKFLVIDLSAMDNLTLNYGKDYEKVKMNPGAVNQYQDLYIINEESHNIFFVKGVIIDGKTFYTDYTYEDVRDEVAVELRYVDNIKIPDGYNYVSGTKETGIVIKNKTDETKTYTWVVVESELTSKPTNVTTDNEVKFLESVNINNGYYKSNTDNTTIYLPIALKSSPIYDKNGIYKDKNGDKATIPEGFTVSAILNERTIDNGLVIYDIPEGETPNWTEDTNSDGVPDIQTKYNQFVWIPVKDADVSYQRDFSYPSYYGKYQETTPENSTFTDTGYLPEGINQGADTVENNEKAERASVLKYNGFYIGRYEAGKDADGTTVVSKQNAIVYVSKTQEEFKEIAKTKMYNNNIVKSAMSSGIQWDMVMHFVDGKKDGTGKKLFNVKEYDETRHTGSKVESGKNNNDKVQNIYDLEGNFGEYVAEKNNIHPSDPFVGRGGNYGKGSIYKASRRNSANGGAYSNSTFRPVLYIM